MDYAVQHVPTKNRNNTVLLSKARGTDVGVIVSSDMKMSEQCGIATRKENQISGLIRRNIGYHIGIDD